MAPENPRKGIAAALSSALFLGAVPIFGKIAINSGAGPFAVIAVRTGIAAILMMAVMVIWKRRYLYIYPVGLAGCILAGFINGMGSILYYSALSRLDASIGHMLYSFYPLFVAIWLFLDRQPVSKITIIRLIITIPAIFLLIQAPNGSVDLVGAAMMLGSGLLYALHLLINQRILFDAPAPTVTLYTLLGMAFTVILAFFVLDRNVPGPSTAWWAILAMALITFFSRFTLFLGVKHLGGMQTALLGISEVFITISLSSIWLGDRLSIYQWAGAGLLAVSLILVGLDRVPPQRRKSKGWLAWLNPPTFPASDF